eukprot:GHVS01011643.1.p1 GENE.GHVS01011643.1~~GHVS01011643.1.p1  ORF type:complete len:629 (-),score=122.06 GHVS01011643.1:700-2493(-)
MPALLLRSSACGLVQWTAGFIGTRKELFAPIFALLALEFAPYLFDYEASVVSHASPSLLASLKSCEHSIILALGAVAANSAQMLTETAGIDDISFVLHSITKLIVGNSMDLENRAGLLAAAGSVISFLPTNKMVVMHSKLVAPLARKVEACLDGCDGGTDEAKRASIKLYFTALQAVVPNTEIPPPPPSAQLEPLPVGSIYRHPVLDLLESQWPLIHRVLLDGSPGCVEPALHSLLNIFSNCRSHAPRSLLLFNCLDVLASSYVAEPTVFHLGCLRTIMGMFAFNPDAPVLLALTGALQLVVEFMLNNFKSHGVSYIAAEPDLVGMTIDCCNCALLHSLLAVRVTQSPWFVALVEEAVQLTPTCHHPKVLHTLVVFLSRLVAWIDPPAPAYSIQPGYPVPWLKISAEQTQSFMQAMLSRPAGGRPTGIDAIVHSTLTAIVNVHSGVQSWIGSATQALLPLLSSAQFGLCARDAFRECVDTRIDDKLMARDVRERFYRECIDEYDPRRFSDLLQAFAEACRANSTRLQFVATSGQLTAQLKQPTGVDVLLSDETGSSSSSGSSSSGGGGGSGGGGSCISGITAELGGSDDSAMFVSQV